jgi:fad oxidoreductase, putative (fragment)
MSLFGINFLRNIKNNLCILDYNPPDICFNPHGYLILHNHQNCEEILNHQQLQNECGAYVDALAKDELAIKFPWLNVDEDVFFGTFGVQDEGWFDPLSLLYSIKAKAEFLGTQYVHGEVIDFNVRKELVSAGLIDETGNPPDFINHVLVQLPNGEIEQIQFAMCYVAAGAQNKEIIDMLNLYNNVQGVRSMPCPVQPRYTFIFFLCIYNLT